MFLVEDMWLLIQNISSPDPVSQEDRDRMKNSEQGWQRPAFDTQESQQQKESIELPDSVGEYFQEKTKLLAILGFLF